MKTDDALVAVFARNAFYRRLHFLALGTFVFSLVVIGFLIWVLVFLIHNPTAPLYFATDGVGRLIEIVPVDRPNMTLDEVKSWAKEAVEAAYSYDYVNFRSQIQSAQKFFTPYGWSKYTEALNVSNNIVAVLERRQVVIAQVISNPILTTQGILSGAYAWKFDMPVLVSYWMPPYDKPSFSNALNVTMIVQRQPILQSYRGLGVIQLIAKFANTPTNQPQEISATPTG